MSLDSPTINPSTTTTPSSSTICLEQKIKIIYIIYFLAIIFWIFLIVVLKLNEKNKISRILIVLVFLSCFSAIIFASQLSGLVEQQVFKSNYLALGIILLVPLIIATGKDRSVQGDKFLTISVASLVLSLISFVPYWLPERYLFIAIHIQSVLQTFSIILIAYSLYNYISFSKTRINLSTDLSAINNASIVSQY